MDLTATYDFAENRFTLTEVLFPLECKDKLAMLLTAQYGEPNNVIYYWALGYKYLFVSPKSPSSRPSYGISGWAALEELECQDDVVRLAMITRYFVNLNQR